MFTGDADGWFFVISDFDIAEQGFPPGTRGADRAARHTTKGIVLHLTRDLAARGAELAAKALGGN
jgi:hypothetical protein